MKKSKDLTPFANILPYASEIFGVYQPMLGWSSARSKRRISRGFDNDLRHVLTAVRARFEGDFELTLGDDAEAPRIAKLQPAAIRRDPGRGGASFVLDAIARELPSEDRYDDGVWQRVLGGGRIERALREEVVPRVLRWREETATSRRRGTAPEQDDIDRSSTRQLQRESVVAGYLQFLAEKQQFSALKRLFYRPDTRLPQLLRVLQFRDPFEVFDPFRDLDRVSLSPLGIVHLFRQYFFEFDTFLGPPVSHVWLSPGSSVELLEVSTRKSVTERSMETVLERTLKTEVERTQQDELSEAVKDDNRSETKFGFTTTANQSWIGGSASATGSIDMASTQQKARESAHKHMRQQTEKLSTEIRSSFKSTFRNVTETTDTSSKRYVLANSTDKLINYELRRKMRQVGVQVQDIGTYLCWQTYVDNPGRELGIAKLVHLAKDPDVGAVPQPEAVPRPQSAITEREIFIPFVPRTEDTTPEDDMDEAYRDGKEVNLDDNEGSPERIKSNFDGYTAECEQPGHVFDYLEFDSAGSDILVSQREVNEESPGRISFGLHVDHVNFRGNSPLRVLARVHWKPSEQAIAEADAKDRENIAKWNEQTRREFEKAFVEAARDRINKASRIERRTFESLREEERIVVYRALIQDLLTKDLPIPDDRTRHVVAELLNSIFDIDKMLYFVAPEWWRPRFARHRQAFGGLRGPADAAPGTTTSASAGAAVASTVAKASSVHAQVLASAALGALSEVVDPAPLEDIDTVAWGGSADGGRDNYYVTENSAPAPLGASLGWLLQLDGDDMRNAFLNAPWVKAVIPVRPGKERAAMNWLRRLHVEGTEGLDDRYVAPPAQLAVIPHSGAFPTIRDAIDHLCDLVAQKHSQGLEVGRYPSEEIDDSNRVSSTPLDKVYEHGFYPLQGGFRFEPGEEPFEVFDQWIEVLPTDQVVPVEVTYDPKTGRQL